MSRTKATGIIERNAGGGELTAALAAIAPHARAAGLGLLLAGPDGRVLHQDPSAAPLFSRYVAAALERGGPVEAALAHRAGRMRSDSPPRLWDLVPGVQLCAVPVLQRRQVVAILILAGRRKAFSATEDLRRLCDRLKLDAGWLCQQAARVPSTSSRRLVIESRLFQSLLRDRLRTAALEEELNSLSNQLANAYEELSLIDQISGGMRVNRRRADFFRQACLDVMQVLAVRGMGVILHHEKCRQAPALYGQVSLSDAQLNRLADQLAQLLEQRKGCLLVNSLSTDPAFAWLGEHATRLLAVPLQRGEQVLGGLFALDKTSGDFDSVDTKLLTSIANESAIYLENAVLFGDVHDLMMGLLHSLTSAVDAKDAYTCGHSERVALLSRHLAAKIGLGDSAVERIYMAGLLHDVGKIGVPESVLQKTGRLTPEEFEQMKKHPEIGARILADVRQLEDIIPGVLYHHERYDGRGYPTGLAGRDIPLMGRIICLADCFDAMTSNRTYRRAFPLEVALSEIRRCSGTQFDPALAEVFLRISCDQFRMLLRDHQRQAKRLLELQQILRAS